MTDAPERIWLDVKSESEVWAWDKESAFDGDVEYVRADLATPLDDPRVLALVAATKNLTDIAHKHTFGKAGILDVHAAVKNTRAALSALEENK